MKGQKCVRRERPIDVSIFRFASSNGLARKIVNRRYLHGAANHWESVGAYGSRKSRVHTTRGPCGSSLDAHRHVRHGSSNSSPENKTAGYLSSVRSRRREIDEEQSTGPGQPDIQTLISAPAGRSLAATGNMAEPPSAFHRFRVHIIGD